MKMNNITAAMLVLALLLGAVMLYASADLMGTMNPDPHSHRDNYSVNGTVDGSAVTGDAVCTPVRENGSFYNYDFKIAVEDGNGKHDYSFFLIFDSEERPFNYHLISSDDTTGTKTYETTENGVVITIEVSENCLVKSFKMTSDSIEIVGSLLHSEVFR